MRHEEGTFAGEGGVEIYWQAWLPEGDPKAVVALAHGASEHSARYSHVGERFAGAGYAVYALDHRGHGRSDGRRAVIDRMDNAVADLLSLIRLARQRHPGARNAQDLTPKVFLLGHSMGGAISIAFTLRHQDELAGLLLSGPVAALEAASPVLRAVSRVLSAATPNLGVFAVESSAVSRDPDVVRAYDEDPLVHHGKLPARTVAELTEAVRRFPDEVPAFTLPMLVMHGSEDTLAPPGGSRMVVERAGSADKTLVIEEGLYHEILNEPEQEQVMATMVDWLDAHA